MKRTFLVLVTLLALPLGGAASGHGRGGAVSLDLTDKRSVVAWDIGGDLLLRAVKVVDAAGRGYGWDLEVVRKPFDPNSSENLLYQSREWHGPHPSQVEAWQIGQKYFPKERELDVRGYPYTVKIDLLNPGIKGTGPDAQFVSGSLKISWRRKVAAQK
jgi:hypothetical protein